MYGKINLFWFSLRRDLHDHRQTWCFLLTLLLLATLPNLVGALVPYPTWLGLRLCLFGLCLPLGLMTLGIPARVVLYGMLPLVLVGPAACAVLLAMGCMPSTFLFLALLETNWQELSVFKIQALLVGGGTLAVAFLYVTMIRRGIPAGWRPGGASRAVVAFAIIGPIAFEVASHGIHQGRAKLDQRLMTTFPSSTVAAITEALSFRMESVERASMADHLELEVSSAAKASGRQVHMLVIGESARKKSFGLYGYERETTPLLERTPGLMVFKDVVATAPVTLAAVPQMLTPTQPGEIREAIQLPSVLSAYRAAGFRVYWLSAQGKHGTFDTLTSTFASDAHESAFLGGKLDVGGVGAYRGAMDLHLLPLVGNVLKRQEEKVLILLHTMGSHGPYHSRYPKSMNPFKVDAEAALVAARRVATNTLLRDEDIQTLVDCYDTTVFATDCLLANLIHRLDQEACASWLCYIADHGENGADAGTTRFMHGVMTPDVLQVPMMMWLSEDYRETFPNIGTQLEAHLTSPISGFSLFHTLLDMGGLGLAGMDSGKSIASPTFEAGPRLVTGFGGGIIDYDADVAPLHAERGGWHPLKPKSLKTAAVSVSEP